MLSSAVLCNKFVPLCHSNCGSEFGIVIFQEATEVVAAAAMADSNSSESIFPGTVAKYTRVIVTHQFACIRSLLIALLTVVYTSIKYSTA